MLSIDHPHASTRKLSLEQIQAFLAASEKVLQFEGQNRAEIYGWVNSTLQQQDYERLGRREKGILRRYGESENQAALSVVCDAVGNPAADARRGAGAQRGRDHYGIWNTGRGRLATLKPPARCTPPRANCMPACGTGGPLEVRGVSAAARQQTAGAALCTSLCDSQLVSRRKLLAPKNERRLGYGRSPFRLIFR